MILWLALLVGVAMIAAGVRGRLLAGGAHCRRCEYDLRGNPAATRCSECGADLTARRAIRLGRRRRRPAILTLGLLVALPTAFVLTPVGERWASRTFSAANAPDAWLIWTIAHRDAAATDAAAAELSNRITKKKLPATSGVALLEALAARQKNAALAWTQWSTDLADQAQFAGLFQDSPALRAFAAGSFSLRAADPLPLGVRVRPGEVALPGFVLEQHRGFSSRALEVAFDLARCAFDEQPTFVSRQPRAAVSVGLLGAFESGSFPDSRMFDSLVDPLQAGLIGPGRHAVSIHLDYTAVLKSLPRDDVWSPASRARRVCLTGGLDLAGDAVIAPAPAGGQEVDGQAFFDAMRLRPNDLNGGSLHLTLDDRGPTFLLQMPGVSLPIAMAVTIREPSGRVWPMQFVLAKGDGTPSAAVVYSRMDAEDWSGFRADSVDVIVESNPSIAALGRVTGPHGVGRREWKAVPVRPREAAARP